MTLLILLAMILLPWLHAPVEPAPRRIHIAPPVVRAALPTSAEDGLELWRVAAMDTLERHLASREGVRAWPPGRPADGQHGSINRESGDPRADPRESEIPVAEADEELRLELECDVDFCRGHLRRIRTADGVVAWHRPGFRLPTDELLAFERELGEEITLAFLRYPQRTNAPRLHVDEEAYRRFLRCRETVDRLIPSRPSIGTQSVSSDRSHPLDLTLAELDSILEAHPRFGDAHLLAAQTRLRRGEEGDAEAALEHLQAATRIAGGDARPIEWLVPLALELSRTELAASATRRFTELLPGDPRATLWRQRLASIAEQPEPNESSEASP